MLAIKKNKPKATSPFGDLAEQERALQEKIEHLKDFVEHGPERERQAYEEKVSTLPPPSEIQHRKREKEFMDRLSRGQMQNEKRAQATNGLLLLCLVLAILALAAWMYKTALGV